MILTTELPSLYVNEITKFYIFLRKKYKDKLSLLSLTGSVAFGKIYENSSDLDFLIILKNADSKVYRDIFKYKNKLKIKSDCIINTDYEVDNCYLDYNSLYFLYLIKKNIIHPLYIKENFQIPISKSKMKNSIKNILLLNIRTLKRIVYDWEKTDSYIILKNISYAQKDFLILQNIHCRNVGETLETFNKKYNLSFPLSIEKCLTNKIDKYEFDILLDYVDKTINILNVSKFD